MDTALLTCLAVITINALSIAQAADTPAAKAPVPLKLAPLFNDHMVLQREKQVPVWGTAEAGTQVTVEFADQKKTATADKDGNWTVTLDPMKASVEGKVMSVQVSGVSGSASKPETRNLPARRSLGEGGKPETISIADVLVGDVWFTAGQSNMGWPLNLLKEPVQEFDPLLRIVNYGKYAYQWFSPEKGAVDGPGQGGPIQGVSYYAAQALRKELPVPVAMVQAGVGSSLVEQWIPEADYLALLKENPSIPERPKAKPYGSLWRSYVEPLRTFPVRGVLWYQGEFNIGDGPLYTPKQNLLFACWRKFWQDEHLPIYFVQLPRHIGGTYRPGVSDQRARFQEVQAASVAPPHTQMVVAFDLGDTNDGNHPSNKMDVGRRMAALMLHYTYGREDIPAHGPTYRSHKVVDGKMVIQFDHVGKGLMLAEKPMKDGRVTKDPAVETPNAKPGHLAICGEDRCWFWAEARIEKDTLVVWSPKVPAPVAVRYAFNVWPQGANLYNRDGLPLAPFRTDDWPQNDEARHYKPGGNHVVSECGLCAPLPK